MSFAWVVLAAAMVSEDLIEPTARQTLAQAQNDLRAGRLGVARANLDSLLLTDGVTVNVSAASPYIQAVRQGAGAWNAVLPERPFRVIGSEKKGDLQVLFVRSIEGEGSDVQGQIRATRELSWDEAQDHAYRLTGTIFIQDRVEGRKLKSTEVSAIVAHELGHILGLADVYATDRLMGTFTPGRPILNPTGPEIDAVLEYRAAIRRAYLNRTADE